MSTTVTTVRTVRSQPAKDWESFSLQKGHVVFQGRYYFAWIKGHFIGAFDTLDDAVESLKFRNSGLRQESNAKS